MRRSGGLKLNPRWSLEAIAVEFTTPALGTPYSTFGTQHAALSSSTPRAVFSREAAKEMEPGAQAPGLNGKWLSPESAKEWLRQRLASSGWKVEAPKEKKSRKKRQAR